MPEEPRPRRRRWRRLLIGVLSAVAAVATLVGGGFLYLYLSVPVDTVGDVEFRRPLAIPPLAESTVDEEGRRVFDLAMRAGETEFREGERTETWGFNGSYLGPTLRAERGEEVVVNVSNTLPEASTVHWHGMHLPAAMDGGPHQTIPAGGNWSPTWTVDQPAATLWYHPHPHGETEAHVQRGLAGLFLVDDPESAALGLPDEYGVNDVPVIVQDASFTDGGAFDHGPSVFLSGVGDLGDELLVNGTVGPYLEVRDEVVRLRLLNASTARIYHFAFDDRRAFRLVATDGGLLEAPVAMDSVHLSPGERAEILVSLAPGDRPVLRSERLDLGLGFWHQRFDGGDDRFDVLQLRAADTLRPAPAVPDRLAAALDLPTGDAPDHTRRFRLLGTEIDDQDMDMSRIDFAVTRGSEEVWEITNADGSPHNFHLHDAQFRVLDVDGERPPPVASGRKDTVFLPPGATVRIAVRFDGPPDPDHPYMYHCHLLLHEDSGMMGQFVVVDEGQSPGTPPGGAHHH